MGLENKVKGAIFGLVIGDALGVPYEFSDPKKIPSYDEIEYSPPIGFDSAYPNIKPGTWSDDSAQALCLLDSLLECGEFDLKNFSDKLLSWLNEGLWAVDNLVFDCGIQTQYALREYAKGAPPEKSGFVKPNGKGNGALMRVMPLAIWHGAGDDNESLIRDAQKQCLVTHGHICNQVCCALYCLWAKRIMLGEEPEQAYDRAACILKGYYRLNNYDAYIHELEMVLQDGNFSGGGYVIDSIRSVRHLLFNYKGYERIVKEAVRLGSDTDTTAAIAGGLAGAYYGFSDIPGIWIDNLRDFDKVNDITVLLYNLWVKSS